MGKTCKLKAVSFQCMTKFTTNKKKKQKKQTPFLVENTQKNLHSSIKWKT